MQFYYTIKLILCKTILGLFNPQHMQYDLERDKGPNGEPSLAEMTDKAIRILSHNTRGYFLMVEGRLVPFSPWNCLLFFVEFFLLSLTR